MSIYLKLIWAYFKISIFGFGGGYAMLSLIRHEIVDRGWITEHMFTDIVAISQMTPGPIGINSATYIGYTVGGGVMGSMVTTLAVILPSFLLVLYTSRFIQKHKDNHHIKGIFAALRPVVVGLIDSVPAQHPHPLRLHLVYGRLRIYGASRLHYGQNNA